MIKRTGLTLFLATLGLACFAQTPSSASLIQNAFVKQDKMIESSLVKNFPTREVGPIIMGGRVVDLAVTKNPKHYYAAFASGGVFVTKNFGASFESIFDHEHALGIGDIALAPSNESVIWVGTGENNSSRSSYSGSGVYKSLDEGKTWEFMGLAESNRIGRIIVHPSDENTVWVASAGALYSAGGQRGVFKTVDGGKSWNRTLFVNDSTGVIDLVIHPTNPSILWASTWQRSRKAWDFVEGGNGSAIWKSIDGGSTWKKSTTGFPQGSFVGRIGLDVSQSNPNIVYAILDNQFESKSEIKQKKDELYFSDFEKMSISDFAKLDSKKLETFLRSNGFESKYTATSVKNDIQNGVYQPKDLANYSGDANAALFETEVKGAEVYRSDDGGDSWKKSSVGTIEGLYYTYGYYFGEIRVDPSNPDRIYVLGVPALASDDAGKTWRRVDGGSVHVDHHALWINPADSDHLLLGNDGGIYSSFDAGKHWTHHNSIPTGQFYTVMVDFEKPYNIYGGLQDNGVYVGSSKSSPNSVSDWEGLMGGDGMHVAVNPQHSNLVYTGFQFGNYFRIDREKKSSTYITPKHAIGTETYRWNWNTPVVLSPHNPDIIYMGSQKLLRSINQGTDFTEISPDLTTNFKPQGNVPYSTITTISESPFEFGLIWVGTDDGNVQLTQNGGATWEKISENLPKNLWISKVTASPHDKKTAYVTLTGYRFDNFEAYAFMTKDFGKTWTKISDGLPNQAMNVLIPDTENSNLLFAGTDHGGYLSFDEGKTWQSFPKSVPNVAVYDLIVHPRDGELVIGTHGRSIYVMDIKPFREILKAGIETDLFAFKADAVFKSSRWGQQNNSYSNVFKPNVNFSYYVGKSAKTKLKLMGSGKKPIKTWEFDSQAGFNFFDWDLVISGQDKTLEFLDTGKYTLVYNVGKTEKTVEFEVKKRN